MAWRRIQGLLVVGALLASTPSHARHPARGVVIALKGAGGGSQRTSAGSVTLVDPSTTEVVSAALVGRPPRATLHPAPGVYMAVGEVVRFGEVRGAVSDPVRVEAEGRKKIAIQLGPLPATVSRASERAGARGGAALVSAVGTVVLTSATDTTATISGPLLAALAASAEGALRWVDDSGLFSAARRAALERQSLGTLDPSTPIVDTPLAPAVRIEGELHVVGRRVQGEIRVITADAARARLDGPLELARLTIDLANKSLELLLRQLAARIGEALNPLGSTSTMVSTTSTLTTTSTTLFGGTCTPGNGADCGPTQCCDFYQHVCCDPLADQSGCHGSYTNPINPNLQRLVSVVGGCCADVEDNFDTCGGAQQCPASCIAHESYERVRCDDKCLDRTVSIP